MSNQFWFITSFVSGYTDSPEYKFSSNAVQIKGRFSVTTENVDIVKVRPDCPN